MNPFGVLPKKTEQEVPTATSDNHYQTMAADPSIKSIPEGSTYDGAMRSQGFTPPVLTGAGDNAAQNAEVLVKNTNEDWINKKWRPAMGWVYMVTCTFDFVIAPILWSIAQAVGQGQVAMQWQPLTLQGAGLYHISMGAVLGLAVYGRTKEKLESKS
jgi:hypothetical protein